MSGSKKSDQDLAAGRNNWAQDTTSLLANEDEQRWGDGLGEPRDVHNRGPVFEVRTGDMARPGGGLRAETAIEATGVGTGVVGTGGEHGVVGSLSETSTDGSGVHGENGPKGGIGVSGLGNPGVRGEANKHDANGVEGIANTGPFAPPAQLDQIGAGVFGYSFKANGVVGSSERGRGGEFSSTVGAGVFGHSERGRGGEFSSSDRIAQLQLKPFFGGGPLPCTGQVGDLLMYSPLPGPDAEDDDPTKRPALYLCIKSSANDDNPAEQRSAVWARFQCDLDFTCKDGVPPAPPKPPHGPG